MVAYAAVPSADKPKADRKVYWRVPTVIFASLLLGVLIAICHHLIYQALDGVTVSSDSQQRWIIRGGTALAFLFKMFLTVATGSAYFQQLWLTVSKRPSPITQIDSMFEILKDATGFVDIALWIRNPLLALTAIITWTIPISAVFTPGTLTVHLQPRTSDTNLPVPRLDVDSQKFYYISDSGGEVGAGPTTNVTRVALSAMSQGSILQTQPHYSDSSYTLDFFGPALQCTPWNASAVRRFQQQSCDYFKANFCPGGYDSEKMALRYLSWTQDSPDGIYDTSYYNDTSPPFLPATNDSFPFPFDTSSNDLYIYVAQESYDQGLLMDPSTDDLGPDIVVTCTFRNASYTVDFSFNENRQTTKIINQDFVNLTYPGTGYGESFLTSPERSYIATWFAFTTLIIGFMTYSMYADGGLPTTIQSTQIANSAIDPLSRSWSTAMAFGEEVQNLFQNVTMSYFSHQGLITNATSSPLTNVNYTVFRNVYSYQPSELWKAYGAGIGVACVCVVIGIRAMMLNGVAFKNSWSTIFRTTRAPEFENLFIDKREAQSGSQPNPRFVETAVVIYTEEGFRLHDKTRSQHDEGNIPINPHSASGSQTSNEMIEPGQYSSDAQTQSKNADAQTTRVGSTDFNDQQAQAVPESEPRTAMSQTNNTIPRKPIAQPTQGTVGNQNH